MACQKHVGGWCSALDIWNHDPSIYKILATALAAICLMFNPIVARMHVKTPGAAHRAL